MTMLLEADEVLALAEIEAWTGEPCEICGGEQVVPTCEPDGTVGPDEPCPFCMRARRCEG